MRLNWFSPLPPAKTAIADYTAQLLPTLAGRSEVVLWTDQAEWDPDLERQTEVRRYQPGRVPWMELNCSSMNVYHVGNNPMFHGSIWQISRRHPGVMILHDLCLQDLFLGLFRDQLQDRAEYLTHMAHYYDGPGKMAALKFWNNTLSSDAMAKHYPLTLLAVEGALGVLVHTRNGFEELRPLSRWPVAYGRLPYAARPGPLQGKPTRTGAEKGAPYRLVVLGHIAANRRLEPLLQALARFPMRQRFHLDVYGQLWDRRYIGSRIRQLGLSELVTLRGFVSKAELDSGLSTAHLAINLRYPTMGEASRSQLLIWDHALPSLVTRVGWYAQLPPDSVAFVRPEHETADIQTHLAAFLANPASFVKLGENGRRFLEENHSPEAYAETVMELVTHARRHCTRAIATDAAKRAGVAMSAWSTLALSGELTWRVAETIQSMFTCFGHARSGGTYG